MFGILSVLLDGEEIGHITRSADDFLEFRYDEDYRLEAGATPLSVSMPLGVSVHPDPLIGRWIGGLLPESVDVLRRWRDEYAAPSLGPFDLLSTPVGLDCAGAVQFCDPHEVNRLVERGGGVVPLTEARIARRLRDLRRDGSAWSDPRLGLQFSLAGGQPKTALYRDGHGWGVPSGGVPTTHLLKPGLDRLESTEVNEHLCLTAARNLGLRTAVSELVAFEDQRAVVVERFDRAWDAGELWRLHTEDFCQALGRAPADKYQHEGGPSPAEIVEMLRRHVPAAATRRDVEMFCDALAYNWMIGAPDAHAKNYSLILNQDLVRMAPLYDIMSAFAYDDDGWRPFMLAMAVGDSYRIPDVGPEDWLDAAQRMRIDPTAMLERMDDLAVRLPAAFAEAIADDIVGDRADTFADRLLDRIDRHAEHCRRVIDRALGGPHPAGPGRGL